MNNFTKSESGLTIERSGQTRRKEKKKKKKKQWRGKVEKCTGVVTNRHFVTAAAR